MPKTIEELGKMIREARERKQLTQLQLAEAVGLGSRIYAADIERGLRIPPSDDVCRRIADVLDIEFVSMDTYRKASFESAQKRFEENKADSIAQVNRDFGANLAEDATLEDVHKTIFAHFGRFAQNADEII